MYYIFAENGLLNGAGQCECLDVLNIEVDEELYNDYVATPNKYILGEKEIEIEVPIYDEEGNIIGYETITKVIPYPVLNPNYEEEEKEKERERLDNLELTGADVERAIYEAKGMDFEDLVQFVIDSELVGFDVKRLKIELKANHFVRKHPYINIIGSMLGYTPDDMDRLFLTKSFNVKNEEYNNL